MFSERYKLNFKIINSCILNIKRNWKYTVTCISDYRQGLDWMTGFIAPHTFTHFRTTGNTVLSLFYTLYNSPLHTH
jgi:hypothetical protein